MDDEVAWGMSWDGQYFLSHGTNLSAGAAVLFLQHLILANVSAYEVE